MPLFGVRGNSIFQKAKNIGSSLLGGVRSISGTIKNVSQKAGGALNTLSNIASNPLVGRIAGALGQGENLQKVQDLTGKAKNIVGTTERISGKVQDLTSPGTYFGQNPIPALRNVVERSKDIKNDVMQSIGNTASARPLIGSNPATYTPRFL
jgi:hypothetical protein